MSRSGGSPGGDTEHGPSSAAFDALLHTLLAPGTNLTQTPDPVVEAGDVLDPLGYEVVTTAVGATMRWQATQLEGLHLLWALTQVPHAATMLADTGVDVPALAASLQAAWHDDQPPAGQRHRPTLAPSARRALAAAHQQAHSEGADRVGARHVLLGLAADADSVAAHALARAIATGGHRHGGDEPAPTPPADDGPTTPRLDEFGWDMTALARAGRLDPVIGRDEQIEQLIEVLGRRGKNNPVLIGDPGVGKTAIVEGLAQRLTAGDVPAPLAGKRLVALDLAGLVAGAKYRGEFEQRFQDLLHEIRQHREQLVVFVDELHTIVGAGAGEGTLDAGTMLKPALARGELHLLGATTVEEYRRHVEADPALERRFQPIVVPEPSTDETVAVLRGLRERFQQHHDVRIAEDALAAAVRLAQRYLTDRFLPDKAVDLLDQACSRVRLRHPRGATAPEVAPDDVADVVSRHTGIPVADLTLAERQRLLGLERQLHRRVIGQDAAVQVVAEAVRRARAGLADPQRPIGSFLFLGPTGVGKTELARALAAALFGDAERMIRFDMGEFQEKHAVSRLVGAPPGYVGYGEPGQLTDRVRRQPYSVLLFDEVEKAHPDVFHSLLTVLDCGRLTDAQGRAVDFRNTVVILTSNIGADRILDAGVDRFATELDDALRAHFRPEFLNRLDEVVLFRPLESEQLREIAGLLLERTYEQMLAKGVRLEITGDALDWLVHRAHQPHYGARPLRRAIQRELDNRLASLVLGGSVHAGHQVVVDAEDDDLVLHVTPAFDAPGAGRHAVPTARGHGVPG